MPTFASLKEEIDDANQRYQPLGVRIERQTELDEWGLVATHTFGPGDLVLTSKAVSSSSVRDSHSIQTDWNTHVRMDLPARLLNHSCHANVGLVDNTLGAYDFVALRSICEGESVVLDYETCEYELVGFQKCYCGSKYCRKLLG